jgi:hypothetical protein
MRVSRPSPPAPHPSSARDGSAAGWRDRPRSCRKEQHRCRAARGADLDRASDTEWARYEYGSSAAGDGKIDTGGTDPAIDAARSRRVPRIRASRQNPAPAFTYSARTCARRIPRALEIVARSPLDRAELFRAALGDGDATQTRTSETAAAGDCWLAKAGLQASTEPGCAGRSTQFSRPRLLPVSTFRDLR